MEGGAGGSSEKSGKLVGQAGPWMSAILVGSGPLQGLGGSGPLPGLGICICVKCPGDPVVDTAWIRAGSPLPDFLIHRNPMHGFAELG